MSHHSVSKAICNDLTSCLLLYGRAQWTLYRSSPISYEACVLVPEHGVVVRGMESDRATATVPCELMDSLLLSLGGGS